MDFESGRGSLAPARPAHRWLAPPSSIHGAAASVGDEALERSSGRRHSALASAHARGLASHITDGGTKPLTPGWSEPRGTAGASSATMARKRVGGPEQRHFFSEPVWPPPSSTRQPSPFSAHQLSARGRENLGGHLLTGGSMEPQCAEPAVRHAYASPRATQSSRQTEGRALVGGAVMPSELSAEAPHSSRGGRADPAATHANFGGSEARALIFSIP
ncbi:hypothetical protein AB1Y20_006213 [Prymnesium parvum]|uniref:Uncharacterized protein n=1 Tax=Prymnesium parvum TaxID=97485 RepID=A0AB34J1M5_PRYPA